MIEVRCFVGIGSNLDQPLVQVENAIQALATIPQSTLHARSSNYESAPLGPQDQPRFINAVASLDTRLSALDLLRQLQLIENRFGRDRSVGHWGPRCIDLDLLLYGRQVMQTENLIIPHPELQVRAFVLYPLREVAPSLDIPGLGAIDHLCANCAGGDIMRLDAAT